MHFEQVILHLILTRHTGKTEVMLCQYFLLIIYRIKCFKPEIENLKLRIFTGTRAA